MKNAVNFELDKNMLRNCDVLKKPVALVFIHLLSVNNGKVQKWCHSILEKRCGAI